MHKTMKTNMLRYFAVVISSLLFVLPPVQAKNKIAGQTIKVSLQKRIPSDLDEGASIIVNDIQEWNGKETAIIICDMWDKHWCKGATNRVGEMAPFMNNVISIARGKGMQIVHAPSDCMEYYKNHPARKLAKKYKVESVKQRLGEGNLECEQGQEWPFEISHGGCDDNPKM